MQIVLQERWDVSTCTHLIHSSSSDPQPYLW